MSTDVDRRVYQRQHKEIRVNVWASSPPRPVVDKKREEALAAKQEKAKKQSTKAESKAAGREQADRLASEKSEEKPKRQRTEEKTEEAASEGETRFAAPVSRELYDESQEFVRSVQFHEQRDTDEDIGPMPLQSMSDKSVDVSYGKALLPGEGAAIAAFVQQNMRIPRRGEIGWNSDDIQNLEDTGYVMSGSRHKRMNDVRIRKENQVYSAEEKRALAMITMEEKQQKDNKIIADFRSMLQQKLGSSK